MRWWLWHFSHHQIWAFCFVWIINDFNEGLTLHFLSPGGHLWYFSSPPPPTPILHHYFNLWVVWEIWGIIFKRQRIDGYHAPDVFFLFFWHNLWRSYIGLLLMFQDLWVISFFAWGPGEGWEGGGYYYASGPYLSSSSFLNLWQHKFQYLCIISY